MEIVTVSVTDLREWENNARIHTKRNLESLKRSLKKYGQTKPLLVQKSTMRIIAGNGTYQAILALGWETAACRLLDLNDADSEALMIADNRIGDLSSWDEKNLLDALQNIRDEGNLELVGYDDVELEKMLAFKAGNMFDALDGRRADVRTAPAPDASRTDDGSEAAGPTGSDPSYEDQINFSVYGFIFSLTDPAEIEEIRRLIDMLKDSDESVRAGVSREVFRSMRDILSDALGQ